MKNCLFSILLLVLLLAALSFAGAEDALPSDRLIAGDFEYILLEDGTVEIRKYSGSAESVEIPAELDGKAVSAVGGEAFSGCYNLKTVTIPDSVTAIRGGAFASGQCNIDW